MTENTKQFDPDFMQEVQIERDMARLAVKLEDLRKASGMTYRELAKKTGVVSYGWLFRLMNGQMPQIRLEVLARTALALGYKLKIDLVLIDKK